MHTVNWGGGARGGALLGPVLRSVRKLLADIRSLNPSVPKVLTGKPRGHRLASSA